MARIFLYRIRVSDIFNSEETELINTRKKLINYDKIISAFNEQEDRYFKMDPSFSMYKLGSIHFF